MAHLVVELPRRAVKTRVKVLFLVLALGIGLPLLAWTVTFFYWHFTIRSAMRDWERAAAAKATPSLFHFRNGRLPSKTMAVLLDARCRALPYMVQALDDSTDPEFREGVMNTIIQLLNPPGHLSQEEQALAHQRYARWSFIAEGLNLEREEKLSDFRAWWRENGGTHHRWWRIWSSNCSAAQ